MTRDLYTVLECDSLGNRPGGVGLVFDDLAEARQHAAEADEPFTDRGEHGRNRVYKLKLVEVPPPSPHPDRAKALGGPGWTTEGVYQAIARVEYEDSQRGTADAPQVVALLADRNRLAALHERTDAALAGVARYVERVEAERDAARADVECYRPLWSDPLAAPNRWTSEPNPHPRPYVSTHTVLEDYDGAIRRSSDWPPETRHAALDRTLGHVRPLVYEVEHLRADLDRLRDHGAVKGEALDKAVAEVRRLRGDRADRDRQVAAAALRWAADDAPEDLLSESAQQDVRGWLRSRARWIAAAELELEVPTDDG